ncbi:MAG TPA: SUMF1/EgtB/PvdO family nonheme iron enzyme, partial [Pirellulaceae bacterium]
LVDASHPPRPVATKGLAWRSDDRLGTMVALGPVQEFLRGSTAEERNRFRLPPLAEYQDGEKRQTVAIPRRFEIASTEVSVADFKAFEKARFQLLQKELEALRGTPDPSDEVQTRIEDLAAAMEFFFERDQPSRQTIYGANHDSEPIRGIRWWDAAAYCRWVSEESGIPENQMCYPSVVDICRHVVALTEIEMPKQPLAKTGYRLPTMYEWEYAARSGSESPWYFGNLARYADEYAWSSENAQRETASPVGTLKPNAFGLFDALGNVAEMCHNWEVWTHSDPDRVIDQDVVRAPSDDSEIGTNVKEIRGGSYLQALAYLRAARRDGFEPRSVQKSSAVGFRVARTLP